MNESKLVTFLYSIRIVISVSRIWMSVLLCWSWCYSFFTRISRWLEIILKYSNTQSFLNDSMFQLTWSWSTRDNRRWCARNSIFHLVFFLFCFVMRDWPIFILLKKDLMCEFITIIESYHWNRFVDVFPNICIETQIHIFSPHIFLRTFVERLLRLLASDECFESWDRVSRPDLLKIDAVDVAGEMPLNWLFCIWSYSTNVWCLHDVLNLHEYLLNEI